jgi:hypothetical protein
MQGRHRGKKNVPSQPLMRTHRSLNFGSRSDDTYQIGNLPRLSEQRLITVCLVRYRRCRVHVGVAVTERRLALVWTQGADPRITRALACPSACLFDRFNVGLEIQPRFSPRRSSASSRHTQISSLRLDTASSPHTLVHELYLIFLVALLALLAGDRSAIASLPRTHTSGVKSLLQRLAFDITSVQAVPYFHLFR